MSVLSTWLGGRSKLLAGLLAWGLASSAGAAVHGTWSFAQPGDADFAVPSYTASNLKTFDFSTASPGASAPGLTLDTSGLFGGGLFGIGAGGWSTSSLLWLNGLSGTYGQVYSGDTLLLAVNSTVKFNFTNKSSYVSFQWYVENSQGNNTVKITLSDGRTDTLINCKNSSNEQCLGSSAFASVTDPFLQWWYSIVDQPAQVIRVNYVPPAGTTVASVSFTASENVFANYFRVDNLSYTDGAAALPTTDSNSELDHVEVISPSSQGMSCQASTFRVRACANSACSVLYTKGIASGTVKVGSATASYSIAAGKAVSSDLSITPPTGSSTVSATSAVLPKVGNLCALGTFTASSACTYTGNTLGVVATLPSHTAGSTKPLDIQLLTNVAGTCTSALTVATKLTTSVTAVFSSVAGNTETPSLGGALLGNGSVVSGLLIGLTSGGKGSADFVYKDVGAVKLTVRVTDIVSNTGSALGLGSITGGLASTLSAIKGLSTDVVTVVAPAAFSIAPTAGAGVTTVSSGSPIQFNISALNTLGNVTKNFGSESGLSAITLGKTLVAPATSRNPTVMPNGSWSDESVTPVSGGIAKPNITWDEVGTLKLTASLLDYLGSGQTVTGTLGSIKFVPAKFEVKPTLPGVAAGAATKFHYMNQPLSVAVSAVNAKGGVTKNYDGSAVANKVILTGLGSSVDLLANKFADGVGSASNLVYSVADSAKQTAPAVVSLTAGDAVDTAVTGASEAITFRSGRIKLSNAFGSEKASLQIPVQVQYWSGKAWVPATDDTYTVTANVPVSAVGRGNFKSHKGAAASGWANTAPTLSITSGTGYLTIPQPGGTQTGTVDVTLDLSNAGVKMPWLQSKFGDCPAGQTVCNPTARATFGVFNNAEKPRTVNVRDVF